jgi:2-dehydro-3-deoxyphosphooctonate aldolase (KDO 8-P synthase)
MKKLKMIAGNCVLEDYETAIKTAQFLKDKSIEYNFELIYKSSFKKDNRSSHEFYRGPTISDSIEIFRGLKDMGITLITDFHNLYELETDIIDVVDILQIPAYLCMQTELTLKMAGIGKPMNIKKGQFLHPEDINNVIKKIESAGNTDISITERGTSFGYRDLIVDPRSFYILKKTGYPVFFDVGHSIRKYGIQSSDLEKGGAKEYIGMLARSAIACDVDGIFVEVHPNPGKAKCDAATQLSFFEFEKLIKNIDSIWRAIHAGEAI